MILRKRIRICNKGITIRCKNRKVLRQIKKFSKEFNTELFLKDMWLNDILYGHSLIDINEVIKNDRYKLDK